MRGVFMNVRGEKKGISKEAKRNAILESATIMFGDKGFFQTKMEDIGRYSKIPKGTIYEYFPSKESLFVECCKYAFDVLMKNTVERMSNIDNANSFMEKFLRSHARVIVFLPPQYMKVFVQIWQYALWNPKAEILQVVEYMFVYIRETVKSFIEKDIEDGVLNRSVDVDVVVKLILGYVDSVTLEWLYSNGEIDIESELMRMWSLIVKGMG